MRTAAWSVPVIALAAPAPAFAASTASEISVIAVCGGSAAPKGRIEIEVAPLPQGAQILIAVSHSGIGGYLTVPDFPYVGGNPEAMIVIGSGGTFTGVIDVTFTGLSAPSQASLLVSVTALTGVTLVGDYSGQLSVQRNSETLYLCADTP